MKQTMRKWTEIGRKGMALLLALVMVLGVCMPVYATGDATEPTEPTTPETTLATEPETVETTAPAEPSAQAETSEPTVETSEPAVEPTVEESSEPEATVGDDAPGVPETTEPETTEPASSETTAPASSETTEPETTVPETTVGDDALGVPDTTVPEQVVTDDQPVMAPAPEKSAYELAMEKLAAMAEEAKTLEATEEVLDEYYERLRTLYSYIFDLYDADEPAITGEEMDAATEIYASVLSYLETTYGYVDGKIQTLDTVRALSNKAIKTATRAESGIIFELFNYGEYINYKDKTSKAETNLAAHARCMPFTGSNTIDKSVGFAHHETPHLGTDRLMYAMNLSDTHYPVLKQCSIASCAVARGLEVGYLFGEGTHHSVTSYKNITNTPLQYDPATGYYSYSSATNAADLSTDKTKIYVREYAERAYDAAGYSNESMADFFPFNSLVGAVDNDGTTNVNHKQRVQEYQYETSQIDYWFGARMHATFYAPKDSMVNGQPMKYEFSGDDDVMVYIDDVYVMDLGGAHAKCSGEIDFYNGLVETWYDCDGEDHKESLGAKYYAETIYDRYEKAYKEKYPTYSDAQIQEMLDEVFVPVMNSDGTQAKVEDARGTEHDIYRFKDYTHHTFDWFYMERWSSLANFNTKFNLPTLPLGGVSVTKELSENSQVTDYTKDEKYTFQLLKQEGEGFVPVKNAAYSIDNVLAGKTDANGSFQISAGKTASFAGLETETNGVLYRVMEKDSDKASLSEMIYSGGSYSNKGADYIEFRVMPNDADNSISHMTRFTNTLDTTDVTVRKKVTGNMGDWEEEFTFTAELFDGKDGAKIPFVSPDADDEYTVSDGVAVFKLKHGEEIKLDHIPLGAYVKVTEEETNYKTTYKVGTDEEEGLSVMFEKVISSQEVEYTNDYTVVIDTGVALDSLPYILIIAVVLVGDAFLFLRKRKPQED